MRPLVLPSRQQFEVVDVVVVWISVSVVHGAPLWDFSVYGAPCISVEGHGGFVWAFVPEVSIAPRFGEPQPVVLDA